MKKRKCKFAMLWGTSKIWGTADPSPDGNCPLLTDNIRRVRMTKQTNKQTKKHTNKPIKGQRTKETKYLSSSIGS